MIGFKIDDFVSTILSAWSVGVLPSQPLKESTHRNLLPSYLPLKEKKSTRWRFQTDCPFWIFSPNLYWQFTPDSINGWNLKNPPKFEKKDIIFTIHLPSLGFPQALQTSGVYSNSFQTLCTSTTNLSFQVQFAKKLQSKARRFVKILSWMCFFFESGKSMAKLAGCFSWICGKHPTDIDVYIIFPLDVYICISMVDSSSEVMRD